MSFEIRPPQQKDADGVASLVNVCSLAHEGVIGVSADQVREAWQSTDIQLEKDRWVFTNGGGKIVGYGGVHMLPPYTTARILCYVHPGYEDRGIGSQIANLAEERAREFLPTQSDPATRLTLHQRINSGNSAARSLLVSQGYKLARHFWSMLIELNSMPPHPQSLVDMTIRQMDVERDAEAVSDLINAAMQYASWNWITVFPNRWQQWFEMGFLHNTATRVVEYQGEVIAISAGTTQMQEDPLLGFIRYFAVREDWRRQGIGSVLLQHSFRTFYQLMKPHVGLRVDTENPYHATKLYERNGMHIAHRYDYYEKVLRETMSLEPERG